MEDYAKSLMALYAPQQTGNRSASAIFGSSANLASSIQRQASVRVGLWPCLSDNNPEAAMGLMTALAFFLESWRDIRVYRLFVGAQGDPDNFHWSISDSQFEVEDWQPESLDENAAVWGTLEHNGNSWIFELGLENDLKDDEEITLSYEGSDIAALVNQLPEIAQDVAGQLDQDTTVLQTYDETDASDSQLNSFLSALFRWQVHLLMTLWGNDQSTDDTDTELDRLLEVARAMGDSFTAWATAAAAAHSLLPGYGDVAQDVYAQIDTIIDSLPHSAFPSVYLGHAVFSASETERAFNILEAEVEQRPQYVFTWLTLAELYRRSGRYMEMLDTFQRGIESDAVSTSMYRNYAAVLEAVEDPEMVEEFVLIDPDDFYDSYVTWEAAAAYDEALQLEPDNVALWARLTQTLVGVADEDQKRFLDAFHKLVEFDSTGEHIRSIIDLLDYVEDIEPLLDILESTAKNHPDNVNTRINLAAAYLISDDTDLAIEELEAAQDMTDDPDAIADIERLHLSASDPEFEARVGEIEALLDGNTGRPSSSDVGFLENMVEQAPSLNEGYILLGRAYLARDNHADALETLMDGLKVHPEEPELYTLITRTLWESGEHDTAFQYLKRGLAINANYIPLLALAGQYLFEDEQEEEAKAYLARAEMLAPRHPALARAREAIVQKLNRNP